VSDIPIHLSEPQQQAVIGHALMQPKIWDQLDDFGLTPAWINSPPIGEAFKKILEFRKTYKRAPYSMEELLDTIKDDLIKEATKRSLAKCVESKKHHPWDVLESKLSDWAKARIIFVSIKDLQENFNSNSYQKSFELWQSNAVALQRIDSICGMKADTFMSVADRVKEEEADRDEDAKMAVPYAGCTFLQDALGMILPTDVILLGATSGAGKTEMAKLIASEVAREKKFPVHYFALEAEPYEIERRIKYGYMALWYKEENPGAPRGMVSYKRWRQNLLKAELDQYRDKADKLFTDQYSTLHAYYRSKTDFDMEDFDRAVYRLKGQSRLIVLDHIHFVDLDARNEVAELSALIKRVRQTAQVLKIPVICVAHLKKSGRSQGLVPEMEDFHGASNLFKTATTGIMMSKCEGITSADSRAIGSPTLIKAVKSRLDGGLLYYTGMTFFNTYTNTYSPYYSVGHLSKNGQKWESLKGELPYWVNPDRNITDISNIE
jgi:hypothetical protein